MTFVNPTRTTAEHRQAHLNWMGGLSYTLSNPLHRLRMAASSCFFGEPMYYHRDRGDRRPVRHQPASRLSDAQVVHLRETLGAMDPQEWRGLSPAELMERAIDEALAHDPEATLQEAVRLRHEEHIRTTPQVILVRAAHHASVRGTGWVRQYGRRIIARADEPAVGLAYQLHRFGKPVPNALKKAWRDALERFDDYQLAKYRLENRAIKTVDVVNLVHPRSEAVDRLVRGQLKTTDRTWEAIISASGSNAEAWTRAVDVMGHMALLRNLRNLVKVGLDPEVFVQRLVDGAKRGKQLPFRYYSAHRALGSEAPKAVLKGVERCLKASLGNLPTFQGRVMSLCDNSGSAHGTTTSSMGTMTIASIANLTAVLTAMNSEEGHVGVFGDRLEVFPVDAARKTSVFTHLKRAERLGKGIGGGTENGIWLFWDRAIREAEHWDAVFVYSDMQAGHGGLFGTNPKAYSDYRWGGSGQHIDVPRLIKDYRRKVNPEVKVFLVQVAGYQDTIVPEFYDRTWILGGWGEGLLRFAASMSAWSEATPSADRT
ncbi:MAG: TROVE domain-containing protein [Myxococcota bacterium]